ncbi:MAG: IS630 family transposase [Methylococcales bacterium]|nr:IS630 family transposase [Methylococcales bacterium]
MQKVIRECLSSCTRIRATAVLLSNQKIPLQDIANVSGVCRQTTSIWLRNWKEQGIEGLIDKPKSGRPSELSSSQETEIIEMVEKSPRSLKKVLAEIEQRWNIRLSKSTLKRLCKNAKLSWKRVRKSLRSKRDDEAFSKAVEEIKILLEKADKGELNFYYFDESGFTLEPCVPYAWQRVGEQIEVPSSKSKRLNVLGFIDRDCHFESYVFEGSITSEVVIACFDKFAENLTKKTVVLIDNASMHTSNAFLENIEKWEAQNLFIQNIPPYSPELNKIEILWRKIKYEWLDFSAYESFSALKKALNNILATIGEDYVINFS